MLNCKPIILRWRSCGVPDRQDSLEHSILVVWVVMKKRERQRERWHNGGQVRLGQALREARISMLPRLLACFVTFSPSNSDISLGLLSSLLYRQK